MPGPRLRPACGDCGLAPLIGAFVAGLLLDDVDFRVGEELQKHRLEELVKPISDIMITIFFVGIGAQVQLETLVDPNILLIIFGLTLVAVLSKGATGYFVRGPGYDRLGIGFGMIPRGEVGLVFAAFASAQGIFCCQTYSALVMVVLLTTLIGPVLLKRGLLTSSAAPGRSEQASFRHRGKRTILLTMKRPSHMLVLLLLTAWITQSVAAVGASCAMSGSVDGNAHDHSGMAAPDMEHSSHHVPVNSGADSGSCCDGGGFCSMSHCQMAAAVPQADLPTGPVSGATVHEALPAHSPPVRPSSLFRPPFPADSVQVRPESE